MAKRISDPDVCRVLDQLADYVRRLEKVRDEAKALVRTCNELWDGPEGGLTDESAKELMVRQEKQFYRLKELIQLTYSEDL